MQLSFTKKKNIRKSFGKLKESLSIPKLIESFSFPKGLKSKFPQFELFPKPKIQVHQKDVSEFL